MKIVEEQLQKGKIQNIAGYLLKAFQSDFRMEETPYDRLLKEEAESKQQQQQEEEGHKEEAQEQEAEKNR